MDFVKSLIKIISICALIVICISFANVSVAAGINEKKANNTRIVPELTNNNETFKLQTADDATNREVFKFQKSELNEATLLIEPESLVILPIRLVTNGHPLKIVAHTISSSSGDGVEIIAFQKNTATNGKDGNSGDYGESGRDEFGDHGENGSSGKNGNSGTNGANAGEVILEAKNITMNMKIENRGQVGGDGGNGGNGGDGGRGGRGKQAVDRIDSNGHGDICVSPAQSGGNGGDGGNGGRGGNAGSGGDGGRIDIKASFAKVISIESQGGLPGIAGMGGKKGLGGGKGLAGWDFTVICGQRFARARNGKKGNDGIEGQDGQPGQPGNSGEIRVQIGTDE